MKVFVCCILKPAFVLSKALQIELIFNLVNRKRKVENRRGDGKLTKAVMALDHLTQRHLMVFSAAMLRTLRDHCRFLPVTKDVKKMAPFFFALLTDHCREPYKTNMSANCNDFVIPRTGGDSIATNIPVVVAVFAATYLLDRKYLSGLNLMRESNAAKTDNKQGSSSKAKGKQKSFEVKAQEIWEGIKIKNKMIGEADCGDDLVDEGHWVSSASLLRTHFLQLPRDQQFKKRNGTEAFNNGVPGDYYKIDGAKDQNAWKMFARCNIPWSEPGKGPHGSNLELQGEPIFSLGGVDVRKCGVPFDHCLHVITSGGFISAEEETRFRKENPNVDLTNMEHVDALSDDSPLHLRIKGARRYWQNLSDDFILFQSEDWKCPGRAGARTVMERLWQIMNYSFDHEGFWKKMEKLKAKVEKGEEMSEEEEENRTSIAGEFTMPEIKKGKKGRTDLWQLSTTYEMKSVRASFHTALNNITEHQTYKDLAQEYDLNKNFGNGLVHFGETTFNSEGPLLKEISQASHSLRTAQFEKYMLAKLEELGQLQEYQAYKSAGPEEKAPLNGKQKSPFLSTNFLILSPLPSAAILSLS